MECSRRCLQNYRRKGMFLAAFLDSIYGCFQEHPIREIIALI